MQTRANYLSDLYVGVVQKKKSAGRKGIPWRADSRANAPLLTARPVHAHRDSMSTHTPLALAHTDAGDQRLLDLEEMSEDLALMVGRLAEKIYTYSLCHHPVCGQTPAKEEERDGAAQ